ncbi:hypothetical protein RhiJN_24242 [Ceratobasidium sp. AG-Ba]|nr:hypothetical protein RhiJN_24242 [Ceratobasidium sp. AG-Ba]
MEESPPRKVSARERRPTQRLNDYDRAQGRLTTLSKSVGRKVTPPTAQSQAADQAKKQAAVAAARGNASRPGELKPLSRNILQGDAEDEDMDELEDDFDDEAGPPLLGLQDFRLEDLENEVDRIEWLNQTLEQLDSRANYRNDPEFQDERSLLKEWKRLLTDGPGPYKGTSTSGGNDRVRTGQTHVLKPQTSGHSSRVRLVRTDSETLGLDGMPVGAQDRREYGQPTPPKLTRTDRTTIGLDGKVVSPAGVDSRRQAASSASRPVQTAPAKRSHVDDSAPSKKRALVPRSRVEALRKANSKTSKESAPGLAPARAKKPRKPPLDPCSPPVTDIRMRDPDSDDDPAPDGAQLEGRSLAPPVDDGEAGDLAGGQADASDASDEAAEERREHDRAREGKLTKRQKAQLGAFSQDARELIQWVTEEIKVDAALICAYPECMSEDPKDEDNYFERWLAKHWKRAHARFRKDKAPVPITDDYARYIRNQLPMFRNSMKTSAEPLVTAHFKLRRSDPDHAETAKDLTDGGDEKWVSPNLENDEQMFEHPIIADTIEQEFFRTPRSFGYRNIKRFTPLIPVPAIAYACAIIRNRIKSFEVEIGKGELNATTDKDSFTLYMEMLNDMRASNPVQLIDIRTTITERYLEAQKKPAAIRVPKMNLGADHKIDMSRLERLREKLGPNAPEIEEWEGMSEISKKGKGKARAGPSGSGR